MNGSLALTAIVGEPGSYNYLAYLNRSDVDVVRGFFGGVVRLIVERRLKTEASDVLQGLRDRLERGDPPVIATLTEQSRPANGGSDASCEWQFPEQAERAAADRHRRQPASGIPPSGS
jgi:hypothetical protein